MRTLEHIMTYHKTNWATPSHSTRQAIFDHYVRTRADEERKEKRAAQKAAVEVYKQLLEEASEDINPKTDYQQFKRKWGTDPRFESLDRKEREALFNEKVKVIEEKVQSMRNAVIIDFKSMLRECKDITSTSRWTKVKENFRSDERYKAVKHEERENIFNEYIAELKSAEKEPEQAAKAKLDEQAKLREREREMRKRKEREEHEMERVKLKIRRKEAVSSYQALLVEMIKDPKVFLPINIEKFHWYLAFVNAKKCEIHVLDSFGRELSDRRDLKTTVGLND